MARKPVLFFLPIFVAAHFSVEASTLPPASYAGQKEMSGYRFKDYESFAKDWRPVTVRYRKDNGEIRFVYANEKAWEALKKGAREYPDGAAFAKIAVGTHDDPAFPSSAVPGGARRYQLMVRDRKTHADTDGWGYALFDSQGLTFPEEPKQAAQACAACHRLVPERGYVFSEIMDVLPFSIPTDVESLRATKSRLTFLDFEAARLPAEIRKHLPKRFTKVRLLTGEISKNLFQGTLDEIRPTLATESAKSKLPSLLLNEKQDRFSVVFEEPTKSCVPGEIGLRGVNNIYFKNNELYEIRFCHPAK